MLPLLPTRQASYFSSCSPRVATCFVAVHFLNWNFCRTADWGLDSVSAFFSFARVHLVTNCINAAPRFRSDSAEVWLLTCVQRKQRLKRSIALPRESKSYQMHLSVREISISVRLRTLVVDFSLVVDKWHFLFPVILISLKRAEITVLLSKVEHTFSRLSSLGNCVCIEWFEDSALTMYCICV